MYIMRLDDASEHMDIEPWTKMEKLLDRYGIIPIYGIIPFNQDSELIKYDVVDEFWEMMLRWKEKGWIPALHGYSHVLERYEGGVNPVNNKSEYAGVTYEEQCQKIRNGCHILSEHGIIPQIFFAPAHTFDLNTLKALKNESQIRVISDTIADNVYFEHGFYFIPQQSGKCRRLPFRVTTFCYHPNVMSDKDFLDLEKFLEKNKEKFCVVNRKMLCKRKRGIKDQVYKKIYFTKKMIERRKL